MTDDPAARLRTHLAEFPGTTSFDPDDIMELLDEHDQLRAENAQIEGLENSSHNYEQWLAEECRKTETLQAQVARVRAFLEDMSTWCSPHGVAAVYAQRGLDALDGVDPLGVVAPATQASDPVDFVTEMFGDGSQRTRLDRLTDGRVMCCLCFEYTPRDGLEPADDGSGDLTDVCKPCAAVERERSARADGCVPPHCGHEH